MIPRVNVGDEAFQPIGDELHRTPQQLRQRDRRHLVRIGVHLDAERAADVLGDDADLLFFQPEMLGEQVLHHVRRLRAVIDGEALLARIPVGHHRARLVAHAGVAAEAERRLDHFVGFGKALVRLARLVLALEGEVVAELGMDHRRAGVQCGLRIRDGGQLLVLDRDQLARILGLRARLCHHGTHRLALPAGALDRDGVLRRRLDALQMRQHADPGRDDFGQFGAGDDRDHAGRLLRRRRIDRDDAGVRMRRAHIRHMRHARQRDVADVLSPPLGEPRQVRPRHRAADIGVRPVERGQDGR